MDQGGVNAHSMGIELASSGQLVMATLANCTLAKFCKTTKNIPKYMDSMWYMLMTISSPMSPPWVYPFLGRSTRHGCRRAATAAITHVKQCGGGKKKVKGRVDRSLLSLCLSLLSLSVSLSFFLSLSLSLSLKRERERIVLLWAFVGLRIQYVVTYLVYTKGFLT